jgi:hypothetical protein
LLDRGREDAENGWLQLTRAGQEKGMKEIEVGLGVGISARIEPETMEEWKGERGRIERGDLIKDYRTFCKLVGEQEATGNSKLCQLARWGKLYKWERKGNAYLITDISLEDGLPAHLKAQGKPQRLDWVTPCFLSLLAYMQGKAVQEQDSYEARLAYWEANNTENPSLLKPIREDVFVYDMPSSVLWKAFGLPDRRDVLETIPEELRDDARRFLAHLYSDDLKKVFMRLRRRAFITWEETITGLPKDTVVRRRATPAEYARFVSAERYALGTLGCKSLYAVVGQRKVEQYIELRNTRVRETLGWTKCREVYAVRATEYMIQAWIEAEREQMKLGRKLETWVGENVQERVNRWLRECVEDCVKAGVLEGRIIEEEGDWD